MKTKKFIKVSKVKKLNETELKNIKGGKPLYAIGPLYGMQV
ncbi:MAG: bacteriocin [Bacteroidales bacterium]|nr:bacteriocin [Bacteroidales bacterium]